MKIWTIHCWAKLISNHKTYHTHQRIKGIFSWCRCSRIGAVFALNGKMSWHIILIFRIILISKRVCQSRLDSYMPDAYINNIKILHFNFGGKKEKWPAHHKFLIIYVRSIEKNKQNKTKQKTFLFLCLLSQNKSLLIIFLPPLPFSLNKYETEVLVQHIFNANLFTNQSTTLLPPRWQVDFYFWNQLNPVLKQGYLLRIYTIELWTKALQT